MKSRTIISVVCCCAHVALGGVIITSSEPEQVELDRLDHSVTHRLSAAGRIMDAYQDSWKPGPADHEIISESKFSHVILDLGASAPEHAFTLEDYAPSFQYTAIEDMPSAPVEALLSGYQPARSNRNKAIDLNLPGTAGSQGLDAFIHLPPLRESISDIDALLEGALYIDWSGTSLVEDSMGLNMKFTQIPEPASIALVIMVSLTGLVVRRRFR